MFRVAFAAVLAAFGLCAALPAQATPVIGLELLIDDSGSITAANYNLQKTAYINALAALLPTDGSVALGVTQFDSAQHPVFALQTITAATKSNLLTILGSLSQIGGSTATGPSIATAASNLLAFSTINGGIPKLLIDVSTDGFGNVGISENIAAANAVAAGIDQVNVLCIGGAANCAFNAGIGSFNLPATFTNFQATLEEKLRRELSTVPEPATLALVLTALAAGAGLSKRRQTAGLQQPRLHALALDLAAVQLFQHRRRDVACHGHVG